MGIEYRRLGKCGLKVSSVCLGTMNFGWHTSVEDSFAIMDRALELGINFFDTADVYGWEKHHGYTEEILGQWFDQGGGRRENVILATKVYGPANREKDDREPNRSGRNLSALKIHRHLEASLTRLRTEQNHAFRVKPPHDAIHHPLDYLLERSSVLPHPHGSPTVDFREVDISRIMARRAPRSQAGAAFGDAVLMGVERSCEL